MFKGTQRKVKCVFGEPHSSSQGDFNEQHWWKEEEEVKLKVVYNMFRKSYYLKYITDKFG